MIGGDIGEFAIYGSIGIIILICLVFYILPMNKDGEDISWGNLIDGWVEGGLITHCDSTVLVN